MYWVLSLIISFFRIYYRKRLRDGLHKNPSQSVSWINKPESKWFNKFFTCGLVMIKIPILEADAPVLLSMNAPFSIRDIAKALSVSPSTVSRALNDHPDISEATRMRVQDYAQKVHYRPNALAIGLKHQRTHTIGVVIPEIMHHFFSSIISGIEDLAYGKGYRVMICQSNEDYLREVINVQALLDHRVDGLLVSISKSTLDYNHFQRVADSGIPIVFFDRVCAEMATSRVVTNDYEGARMLVHHLVKRGCRTIMHLAGPQHLAVGRERYQGFCDALKEAGIPLQEDLVLKCDTPAKVEARRTELLQLAGRVDGIFAVNDFTAVAAMRLLQENGIDIPGTIAVAGFGDDPLAALVRPALTTVEQRGYDMGREAAQILMHALENKETRNDYQTRVFPASLKIRDSA